MKRLTALLFLIGILLCFAACGSEKLGTEKNLHTASHVDHTDLQTNMTEMQDTESANDLTETKDIEDTEQSTAPMESEEDSVEAQPYLQLYQDIINDFQTILRFRFSDSFEEEWNGENGVSGISATLQNLLSQIGELEYEWNNMIFEMPSYENDQNSYGYILHDINADDIPELFWVRDNHDILAAFTYYDDSVCLLRGCWSRFNCYISQNNTLYCWGSSGAADNFCSSYVLHNGELIESYRFYSEGDFENYTVHYFETSTSTKIEILSDRYDELKPLFPYENSEMWCSSTIYPLSTEVNDAVSVEVPQEGQLPYLLRVNRADQSIWDGPGYDYCLVGTVEFAGTYTITAEVCDYEGNLWGRLKSGVGWIDLSEIAFEKTNPPILTVNYADNTLLRSGNFHHCAVDHSEYMVQVAFRAHQTLKDVSFFSITVTEEADKTEELFHIDEWTPDKPFVADVAFPGDMSMYGISFTDSYGVFHTYAVSISGRNSSVVLFEYGD